VEAVVLNFSVEALELLSESVSHDPQILGGEFLLLTFDGSYIISFQVEQLSLLEVIGLKIQILVLLLWLQDHFVVCWIFDFLVISFMVFVHFALGHLHLVVDVLHEDIAPHLPVRHLNQIVHAYLLKVHKPEVVLVDFEVIRERA